MKTLNRCAAKIGDLIKINSNYSGDQFPRWTDQLVSDFDKYEEEVAFDFEFNGQRFTRGETVSVVVYKVKSGDEIGVVWPFETDQCLPVLDLEFNNLTTRFGGTK